jgi:hypothetical protein
MPSLFLLWEMREWYSNTKGRTRTRKRKEGKGRR